MSVETYLPPVELEIQEMPSWHLFENNKEKIDEETRLLALADQYLEALDRARERDEEEWDDLDLADDVDEPEEAANERLGILAALGVEIEEEIHTSDSIDIPLPNNVGAVQAEYLKRLGLYKYGDLNNMQCYADGTYKLDSMQTDGAELLRDYRDLEEDGLKVNERSWNMFVAVAKSQKQLARQSTDLLSKKQAIQSATRFDADVYEAITLEIRQVERYRVVANWYTKHHASEIVADLYELYMPNPEDDYDAALRFNALVETLFGNLG